MNKSLMQAEEREGGELRYGLLETVRQYGQERLVADGATAVRDRHRATLAGGIALFAKRAPDQRPPSGVARGPAGGNQPVWVGACDTGTWGIGRVVWYFRPALRRARSSRDG